MGTCPHGLIWLDEFGGVHGFEVGEAETQHSTQGVMVGREGVLEAFPREGEEGWEIYCLNNRHGGGSDSRRMDAVLLVAVLVESLSDSRL